IDAFYFFGRNSCINTSGFYDCILGQYSSCSNDGIAFYYTIIHHDSTHSDKYIILNRTAMNNGIVAYRNVIPDDCRVFLISTVNDGSILNIYFIADFNIVYITSYHSIEPNTTLVSHGYISYDSSIFSNKTIIRNLRTFSVYRFNNHCYCIKLVYAHKYKTNNPFDISIRKSYSSITKKYPDYRDIFIS